MSDLHVEPRLEELRVESDAFLAQLELLHELESRKREIAPNDPRYLDVAGEVEGVVGLLLARSRRQTALGTASNSSVPVMSVPVGLSAVKILERWREVEQRLRDMDPTDNGATDARREADAYMRAYEDLYRGGAPGAGGEPA
jgi:hypothetical protein